MKYSNRSLWKRFTSSPVTMVLAVIVLVILAKATWNITNKATFSADKLEQAQAEFSRMTERRDELAKKVEYLSTEQGIETEMRTKYHAVRDGESVAVIIDKEDTAVALVGSENATSSSTEGWFMRMLRKIGF